MFLSSSRAGEINSRFCVKTQWPVADLGEGPGPGPPLILGKKRRND